MKIPRDIVGFTEYILDRKLLNTSDIPVGRGSARINWAAIFALCIFRHEDWIKDLDEKR